MVCLHEVMRMGIKGVVNLRLKMHIAVSAAKEHCTTLSISSGWYALCELGTKLWLWNLI